MNRCCTVHGSYYLAREVAALVATAVKPNAAGLWIENANGHYLAGGISGDVTDITSIDIVAEELRRAVPGGYLNLTHVNERRRQLGRPYISECELPHTV